MSYKFTILNIDVNKHDDGGSDETLGRYIYKLIRCE